MNYQYIRMPNVMEPSGVTSNGVLAKSYAHGSGRMIQIHHFRRRALIAQQTADYSAKLMDYQEALSTIQIRDDNKITYNPTTISLDLGFMPFIQ